MLSNLKSYLPSRLQRQSNRLLLLALVIVLIYFNSARFTHTRVPGPTAQNPLQSSSPDSAAPALEPLTPIDTPFQPVPPLASRPEISAYDPTLACSKLEGADDILVILKTGATEVRKRLPAQVETILRCIPHYAIYSDLEEDVAGQHIHDALDEIPEVAKSTYEDFEFYRKLRAFQREGKDFDELLTAGSKEDGKGWMLDKWKFLPLLDKALQISDTQRWYIFIETDTFVVWSNLLQWLAKLDTSRPRYIGSPAWINDQPFAHGGSGYILSNKAVRMLAGLVKGDPEHYADLVANECCGDYVIAKVGLEELDFRLTGAWPIIQGETPASLDYSEDNWCRLAVTFHHVSADELRSLWRFEQDWMASAVSRPSLHSPPGVLKD